MTQGDVRGGRGRRRPPPRRVEVVAVEPLSPRFVSITVGGAALEGFGPPGPTAHIKFFLPGGDGTLPEPVVGAEGLEWPHGRPTMRTYTPRRFDPEASTLEVLFYLHDHGPASDWASRAAVGDLVAIGGPGGRFELDAEAQEWWIAGDESALPAIATLLEALPLAVSAEVHLEVGSVEDQIPMPTRPGVEVIWHQRSAELGAALEGAVVDDSDGSEERHFWIAAEAGAARSMRRFLLLEREVPARQVTTRGYWRLGAADHPDHDFGED